MKPGSQNARLLAVLSDHDWHTTAELLRAVPCIVHSRCAELRKRGYAVEHETTGPGAAGSRYRLLSEAESVGKLAVSSSAEWPTPSGELERLSASENSLASLGTEPNATAAGTAAASQAGANGRYDLACPDGAAVTASVVRADTPATGTRPPSRLLPVAGAQLSLEDAA